MGCEPEGHYQSSYEAWGAVEKRFKRCKRGLVLVPIAGGGGEACKPQGVGVQTGLG